MVRAEADFLRGAWPFFEEDELFDELFLPDAEPVVFLCVWPELELEVVCAENPAPCRASKTARNVDVNRDEDIVAHSVTRYFGQNFVRYIAHRDTASAASEATLRTISPRDLIAQKSYSRGLYNSG